MGSVALRNIRKSYGAVEVLHGIDLDIQDGEFTVLVGPSGCGKSTLLRSIAGLETISGGDIAIDDAVINQLVPKDRDIAMVFQNYALYPHMTVAKNMGFSLRLAKESQAEIDRKVKAAAEILDLTALLDRYPRQLSGGQRQRVAMGRAIVRDPKVFLFDEPLSNLDAKLREKLRTEIRKIHMQLKTTTIFVTHDQLEAMTIADRIVLMRDGRIEQMGTPDEIYERPATRFVADFIGTPAMNFVSAEIAAGDRLVAHGEGMTLELSRDVFPDLAPGQRVELGLRPARMDLCAPDARNVISGSVVLVENMGAEGQVITEVAGREVSFVTQSFRDLSPGDPVTFAISPDHIHVFDPSTGRSLRRN